MSDSGNTSGPQMRAQSVLDELCDNPLVWKTHGIPNLAKMAIIKDTIAQAIEERTNICVRCHLADLPKKQWRLLRPFINIGDAADEAKE